MTKTPDDATVKVPRPSAKTFVAGRYAVQSVLGEGGQKLVYLVHDKALDRDCALALIRAESLEAEELERFRREAQVMARFGGHQNIVTVFDTGEEDGRPYLICEYVPGGDLRNEVRKVGGPLAIDRALSIGGDLATALAIAHDHGVIHRDLKPANVWLAEDSHAKLGDFGLAMALDRSRLTMPGTMMGTAAYMPPEQALGGEIDARSDLYSLGCVLYELVAGRPPFLGDDIIAVVSQHINAAPVAPSWHNPAIPRALDTLILHLLSKSPEERPESADAVVRALSVISSAPSIVAEAAEQVTNPLDRLEGGLFIGRGEEMGELRATLESALSGRGRLTMIEGEAGIGKTRLIEELCTYGLLRGVRVLSGRCYEGDGAPPFWPWVQPIRQYVQENNAADLEEDMGPGAADIAQIVPEIHERIADLKSPPPLEPEQARFRLFDSVTTFLKNASRRKPLVLVLDDLHWADNASLLLIQFLARELGSARLLIVGAYRDIELDRTHPLSDTLEALRREPVCERLVLRGLSQGDVGALMSAMGEQEAAESLVRVVYEETEGNPFFIEEIFKHLIEEGKIRWDSGQWTSDFPSISQLGIPEGVRAVISRRISRLSEECIRMLTLASAMTGGFSWDEFKATSSEDEAKLLDLLDEALAAQLIHERKNPLGAGSQSGSFEFTHALIRHTLYETLSTPRRALLHRRIGESLERLYEGRTEEHLAELAQHFSAAAPGGDIDKAVNYGLRAGDVALLQFAYEDAAAHYDAALRTLTLRPAVPDTDRYDFLAKLGDALVKGGETERGREHLLRAVEIARNLGDAERLAQTALLFSPVLEPGVIDSVHINLLEESIAALGTDNDLLRTRLLARLANELLMSFLPGSKERGRSLAEQAIREARLLGNTEALFQALDALFMNSLDYSDIEEGLAISNEMVTLADGAGDPSMSYVAHTYRSMVLLEAGDLQAFELEYEILGRLAEELRQPRLRLDLLAVGSALAFSQGRFKEGREQLRRLLADGERTLSPFAARYYVAINSPYELDGDPEDMTDIESALDAMIKEGAGPVTFWRSRLAYFYCEMGREPEARRQFEEMATAGFGEAGEISGVTTLAWAARICSFLGDCERASVLYEVLKPYATHNVHNGNEVSFGSVSRYLGLLATTMSRWQEAARHFEDALEMNTRWGARPWTALTQLDYAKMLLARDKPGDREKALALLDEALKTSQELGMQRLADRANAAKATPS